MNRADLRGGAAAWWLAARRSRLLGGGMIVAVVVVGGLCGLLVVSRGSQGSTQNRVEASGQAASLVQVLNGFVQAQAQAEATSLTASTALRTALAAPDPSGRTNQLTALFQLGSVSVIPGSRVAILDSAGIPVYTDECGQRIALSFCEGQPGPHLGPTVPSVALAIAEGTRAACAANAVRPATVAPAPGCPGGYAGLDVIAGTLPAFDSSIAVWDPAGKFVGVVVVSTTVQAAFHRVAPALLDPPAVITIGPPALLASYDATADGAMKPTPIPAILSARVSRQAATIDEQYTSAAGATVNASFVGIHGPDGRVTGYLGVEAPTAASAAQTRADQWTILLFGIGVLALVFLVLASLPSLVPRLAAEPAPAGLAASTDGGWARLVSDVQIVQRSVVDAAAEIGGPGSRVSLFAVVDGRLEEAVCSDHGGLSALGLGEIRRVLDGATVRREPNEPDPPLLLVPARVDGTVRGAVAVWSEAELSDAEASAVAAVAGGGVTALERMRVS